MAGAKVSDIVHARILRFFPELVAQLGAEPRGLLRGAGLDEDYFVDGRCAATYRQMIRLIELAAAELDCPDFGMRLATLQGGGGMFGPLGLVMRNSRTFGDALAYVAGHTYAHSLAARVWLKRLPRAKAVFCGHDILIDGAPNKAQAMEQILLVGHLAALDLTGGRARVRRVHFRHQPLSPPRRYRRYFGCEVRFGQNADGVIFFDRDLGSPIAAPDAKTLERVTAFIDESFPQRAPLHAQARGVIMESLWTGGCTNERVAAELKLHARTLHRRLRAEGTSFQKIKDEVRRDILLYYVRETNLDFARISERLGFAEQSVMTRSCRRWLRASPTKLRSRTRRPVVGRPARTLSESVKPLPPARP